MPPEGPDFESLDCVETFFLENLVDTGRYCDVLYAVCAKINNRLINVYKIAAQTKICRVDKLQNPETKRRIFTYYVGYFRQGRSFTVTRSSNLSNISGRVGKFPDSSIFA